MTYKWANHDNTGVGVTSWQMVARFDRGDPLCQ